jgi:hypothetical protein
MTMGDDICHNAPWYQIRMILPVVISCLHDPRPQRVSFTQDGYHRREPVIVNS